MTLGILRLMFLLAWSPWDSLRYRGDGQFSNRGFFSNPRSGPLLPGAPRFSSRLTFWRPPTGFDAVLTREEGLSKLVETLKALLPEAP